MTPGGAATSITLLIVCALVEFSLWIQFVVAMLARRGDVGPNRFELPPVTETTCPSCAKLRRRLQDIRRADRKNIAPDALTCALTAARSAPLRTAIGCRRALGKTPGAAIAPSDPKAQIA